jgi:hypothetical protein
VVVQLPQWSGSVWRSTHAAPQRVGAATVQVAGPQTPEKQASPAAQALPHPPQLAASLLVETQAPPQTSFGAGQVQAPPPQTPGAAQGIPQPPQFTGSVAVETQAPPQVW